MIEEKVKKVKVKRAKTRVESDKNVYELAKERVHRMFDIFDTVAVAFSGGKDSTATLNIVTEVAAERGIEAPIKVIFYDEEAIPFETEQYVRRVSQRTDVDLDWYCIPFIGNNACSKRETIWYPWAEEVKDKWVRPLPPEAITEKDIEPLGFHRGLHHYEVNGILFDPQKYGNVGLAMGIRAQESITRTRAVTQKVKDNFIVKYNESTSKGNLWRCYPIYDWKTEDVWTAPRLLNWDTNFAYDLMEMAGVSRPMQRCSPPYANEPLVKLWTYKVCFPDIWDKMYNRVEGAATAARYSNTELYGYGKRPKKPAGIKYEDWLKSFINMWPDYEQRYAIAERMKQELEKHFSKTPDPLVEFAPHPISGVSWDFLIMIAIRGDERHRKSAVQRVSEVEKMPQYWKKYNEERKYLESIGEI